MAYNDQLLPCIYKLVLYNFYEPALCSQVLCTLRAVLPYSIFMSSHCRYRYSFFMRTVYPGAVFLKFVQFRQVLYY